MSFLSDLHELSYEAWINAYEGPVRYETWLTIKAQSANAYYTSLLTESHDAYGNVKLGTGALANLPVGSGADNVALGDNALNALTSGSDNIAIGEEALLNVTAGSFNTAVGDGAGKATGVVSVTNGVFLGRNAVPSADGSDNEIVIGVGAEGNGNDTTTLGNAATEDTYIAGTIHADRPVLLKSYTVSTLPTAATYTGGLIYVSNGTANKRLAISDGTNWRFPDGNVVS